MSMQAITLYTAGHSDRRVEELMCMLGEAGVTTLVDVRAQPHSARHPQFNEDALRDSCSTANIIYHWAGRHLGGKRPPRPGSPHVTLDEGRRGFADYMQTEVFQKAAAQLASMSGRAPTAMLCAEREPEHCHRALIADYLLLQGLRIVHLVAPGEQREHLLSPAARRESAALIYDRHTTGALALDEPPG
jgi:uncharacterized protein (DUF488 family)